MATSLIKTAITDLKARCLTIPGIVYCAVFNDQVKQEDTGKTFVFAKPAILIEIQSPSQGVPTLGSYAVTVHDFVFRFSIVHEQLNAEYTNTAGSGMDENLDIFDLRDLVKTYLTGFRPTNCSNLLYEGESQDYAHGNIYVYGISFKTSFTDTKGSPLDVDSTVLVNGEIEDINLNTFVGWISGKAYTANKQAIAHNGLIYLCSTTNSDTTFTVGNWRLIPAWVPGGTYTITTSYVAYQNKVYQCAVSNTDSSFTVSKWTQIV